MRLDHLLSKEQTIISGFGAVCVPAMVCSRVKHKKSISITAGQDGSGVGGGCASDRRPGLLHTIGVLRKHRPTCWVRVFSVAHAVPPVVVVRLSGVGWCGCVLFEKCIVDASIKVENC